MLPFHYIFISILLLHIIGLTVLLDKGQEIIEINLYFV
jgi:hypothetical protein